MQVVKTTNQLIVDSLYLIGELATNETPDAYMLSTGVDLLNEILAYFTAASIYIPFLTTIDFNLVAGKSTYSISDMVPSDIIANKIVDLSFANYTVPGSQQGLIYPLKIISKAEYYGVTRQTPLNTRPAFIFLDKQAQQSFITLYPAPDQPYPCSIKVKTMMNSVSANQDLLELPPYYYGFLKYALGREFIQYYPSGNWTDKTEQKYQQYYTTLKSANERDLTIRPSAILIGKEPFYWQNILVY